MDLSSFKDYKKILKTRLDELKEKRTGLTLRKLSEKIPIQYTYLSKVLNHSETHLSEDHLFRTSQLLNFFPQEIDYILLLRAYQTAELPARRDHAFKRLASMRKDLFFHANIEGGENTRLTQEMAYLLDPFSIVVYVGLHVPAVCHDPRLLLPVLGLSLIKLKEILKILSHLELIEMGTGPLSVVKVNQNKIHYNKEHPLMRVHQHLFKTANLNQLLKLSDDEKESFQVTFSAEKSAFEEVRLEFKNFLKKIESIAMRSKKNERVLQLNFDLFHWY